MVNNYNFFRNNPNIHVDDRGDRLLLESIFHSENSTLDIIQELENRRGGKLKPVDPFKGIN